MLFSTSGFPQTLQKQQLSILPSTPARSATPCQPENSLRKASRGIRAIFTETAAEPCPPLPVKLPEPSGRKNKVAVSGEQDLKKIPYVGPKNAQLFTAAGIYDLKGVREWFYQECSQDVETCMQQLQGRVGIKHKLHRERIAHYLVSLPPVEEAAHVPKYVTVSVEGNISAGKSTFLKGITKHCPDLQDLLHVVPEPVDRWQNVGNHNLLDKFYHDKERYAYTFQNYIFFTRMMQEQDSARVMKGGSQPYRLLERSIFCDRMVFVESLKDSNILSEMELSIYDSWFDPVVAMAPTLVPDGFIYLRAMPQTCMSRLKHRARDEETGVDIRYLEDLHQRHDAWLYQMHENSAPAIKPAFDQVRDMNGRRPELARIIKKHADASFSAPSIPDFIRSDVKLLNRELNGRLHHTIHDLPALVLDCEKDIHDLDAQKEHAHKVNTYFEYVKAMRKHRAQLSLLEGLATNKSSTVGEVHARFAAAKMNLDPEWRPEVERTFHLAMAEHVRSNSPQLLQSSGLRHC